MTYASLFVLATRNGLCCHFADLKRPNILLSVPGGLRCSGMVGLKHCVTSLGSVWEGRGLPLPDEEGEGLHLTVGGKGSPTDEGRERVSDRGTPTDRGRQGVSH